MATAILQTGIQRSIWLLLLVSGKGDQQEGRGAVRDGWRVAAEAVMQGRFKLAKIFLPCKLSMLTKPSESPWQHLLALTRVHNCPWGKSQPDKTFGFHWLKKRPLAKSAHSTIRELVDRWSWQSAVPEVSLVSLLLRTFQKLVPLSYRAMWHLCSK